MPQGEPAYTNKAITDAIIENVRQGNSFTTAAELQGLTGSAVSMWMKRSLEEDAPAELVELVTEIKRAKAEAIAEMRGIVKEHSRKTWQAADRWLRANDKDWKDLQQIELSGPGGGPIPTRDLSSLSDEQIRALADKELSE